jgi:hypothetical protein
VQLTSADKFKAFNIVVNTELSPSLQIACSLCGKSLLQLLLLTALMVTSYTLA